MKLKLLVILFLAVLAVILAVVAWNVAFLIWPPIVSSNLQLPTL